MGVVVVVVVVVLTYLLTKLIAVSSAGPYTNSLHLAPDR